VGKLWPVVLIFRVSAFYDVRTVASDCFTGWLRDVYSSKCPSSPRSRISLKLCDAVHVGPGSASERGSEETCGRHRRRSPASSAEGSSRASWEGRLAACLCWTRCGTMQFFYWRTIAVHFSRNEFPRRMRVELQTVFEFLSARVRVLHFFVRNLTVSRCVASLQVHVFASEGGFSVYSV